jgi:cell division inhibitor SepF
VEVLAGLFDKFTNFFMAEEDGAAPAAPEAGERRPHLRVHSPSQLKVFIATPQAFDDVRFCADYLKSNVAVLVNYESIDDGTQQRITDFLNGVCFVSGGTSQRVSDTVAIYVPAHVDVNKEMYAYSVPTYVKRKKDL